MIIGSEQSFIGATLTGHGRRYFFLGLLERVARWSLIYWYFVFVLSCFLAVFAVRPQNGPAIIVYLLLLIFVLIAQRKYSESATELLRRIETVNPQLRGILINALQLQSCLAREGSPYSTYMIEKHLETTENVLKSRKLQIDFDYDRILLILLLFAFLANIFLIKAVAITGVQPNELRLSDLLFPTDPASRKAIVVSNIDLVLHYPGYTGIKERHLTNSDGNITAIRGTVVDLSVRVNGGIDRAAVFLGTDRYQMTTREDDLSDGEGQKSFSVAFPLTRNEKYGFSFASTDNEDWITLPERYRIDIVEDTFPEVIITHPDRQLELNPSDKLEVGYRAKDDFPLHRLEFVYRLNEGDEQIVPLNVQEAGTSIKGKYMFDLGTTRVIEGDTIEYLIRGFDIDSISGPKQKDSERLKIVVFSLNAQYEQNIETQNRIKAAMVDALASAIELETDVSKVEKLYPVQVDRFDEILGLVGLLLEEGEKETLFSARIMTAFLSLQERLRSFSEQRRTQMEAGLWKIIASRLSDDVRELEIDLLLLIELMFSAATENVQDLIETANILKEELQRLLDEYRKHPSEEILKEITKIINKLKLLLERIEHRMASVRSHEMADEFMNADALARYTEQNDMSQVLRDLEQGDIAKAMETADSLFSKLSTMLDELEKPLEQMNDMGHGQKDEQIIKLLDNLSDLASGQKKLLGKTEATINPAGSERRQLDLLAELEKELKDFDRILEKLRYQQTDVRRLQGVKNTYYWQIKRGYEKYTELFKKREFKQMARENDTIEHQVKSFIREILSFQEKETKARDGKRKSLGDLPGQVATLQSSNKAIARTLDRLLNDKSLLPDDSLWSELTDKQKEMSKRFDGLRNDFGDAAAEMPLLEQMLKADMEKLADEYDQTVKQMEQVKPGPSIDGQKAIYDRLNRILEQTSQMSKMMKQGRQGIQQRMVSHEKEVRIPTKEEDKSGIDRRKEIAESLKEPLPENYKKLIERYYERILE